MIMRMRRSLPPAAAAALLRTLQGRRLPRLTLAKLTQAKLTQAMLTQAMLTQAKLTQAMLTQAMLTVAMLTLAAPPGGAGEVVVSTGGGSWEAAQKAAYFDPFEAATGIRVVRVPSDTGKLLASIERGRPEADLAYISAGMIASFVQRQALERIDYSHFDAETLQAIPAPLKHDYGIGAILYAVVMAYNEKEYPPDKPRPQSWADFFDVARFPGPRGLAGCGDQLISGGGLEFAMLAAGADRTAIYPIDIDRAFAMLAALKPHVGRWWQMGGEAPQGLIDGELAVSTAFNGRIYQARQQGAPVGMTWRDALVQYDYWVVPKNSPNRDNAMKFLAFISQARPQADFANRMAYGPINRKAYDFIRPELAQWLPGSPQTEAQVIYQDYRWWTAQGADGKTNWDRVMARCVQVLSR